MIKRIASALIIAGMACSAGATTNARCFSLGQAYFVGDIMVTVPQAWQILGYPDQIQGSSDLLGDGKPGPVIMIKSLGQSVALGMSLNTFDRRTSGSILATNFYDKSLAFAEFTSNEVRRFPNFPQVNFAFKVGGQKFGINAFYETNHFYDSSSGDTSRSFYQTVNRVSSTNVGGCISGRIGIGNFGWNPWLRIAVPMLSGSKATTDTGNFAAESDEYRNAPAGSNNLMYNVGSCFDYTIGHWGWAIVGAWYRNEQYKFEGIKTRDTVVTNSFSPNFKYDFYDYFASFTPHVFKEAMIGFEYQGAYQHSSVTYEDNSREDTTGQKYFNDFIVALEKPMPLTLKWLDILTLRASFRYSVAVSALTYYRTDGSVFRQVKPMNTLDDDGKEGMNMLIGAGFKKSRVTVDVASSITGWRSSNIGVISGPPLASFTLTLDLH